MNLHTFFVNFFFFARMAEKVKRKGETALDRKLKRLKREVPSTDLDTNKEDASSAVDESSTNPPAEVGNVFK